MLTEQASLLPVQGESPRQQVEPSPCLRLSLQGHQGQFMNKPDGLLVCGSLAKQFSASV